MEITLVVLNKIEQDKENSLDLGKFKIILLELSHFWAKENTINPKKKGKITLKFYYFGHIFSTSPSKNPQNELGNDGECEMYLAQLADSIITQTNGQLNQQSIF